MCVLWRIYCSSHILFQFIEESAFLEFGENVGVLLDSVIKQLVYNIMTSSKSKLILFLFPLPLDIAIFVGLCVDELNI